MQLKKRLVVYFNGMHAICFWVSFLSDNFSIEKFTSWYIDWCAERRHRYIKFLLEKAKAIEEETSTLSNNSSSLNFQSYSFPL